MTGTEKPMICGCTQISTRTNEYRWGLPYAPLLIALFSLITRESTPQEESNDKLSSRYNRTFKLAKRSIFAKIDTTSIVVPSRLIKISSVCWG